LQWIKKGNQGFPKMTTGDIQNSQLDEWFWSTSNVDFCISKCIDPGFILFSVNFKHNKCD